MWLDMLLLVRAVRTTLIKMCISTLCDLSFACPLCFVHLRPANIRARSGGRQNAASFADATLCAHPGAWWCVVCGTMLPCGYFALFAASDSTSAYVCVKLVGGQASFSLRPLFVRYSGSAIEASVTDGLLSVLATSSVANFEHNSFSPRHLLPVVGDRCNRDGK